MALVMDAREGVFLQEAPRVLDEVRRAGHQVEVLFLDASDESLIRRFSETRRRHPLAPDGQRGRGHPRRSARRCSDLRELADQVIDTSALNVHDLKRLVQARFSPEPANAPVALRHVLRLPLRRAAAGGPGVRRALPAQPVLRPGAEGPHRREPEGGRVRAGRGPRRRSSSRRSWTSASSSSPATRRRGRPTSRSRWGAPAASTARWPSPMS